MTCAPGWTANSDLYDQLVANGVMLSCNTPNAAIIVLWSLNIVTALYRAVVDLIVVLRHVSRAGSFARSLRNPSVVVLVVDMCITCPLFFTACALKLGNGQTASIGTDVPLTVIFTLSIFSAVITGAVFQFEWVSQLLQSYYMSNTSDGYLESMRHYRGLLGLVCASYLLNMIPTLVALALDHSLGPMASGEYIIIITRNIGVVVWQLTQFIVDWRQKHHLELQLRVLVGASTTDAAGRMSSLPPPPPTTTTTAPRIRKPSPTAAAAAAARDFFTASPPSTVALSKAEGVLNYMQSMANAQMARCVLSLVLYSVFSLPVLWPYQSFAVAFAMFLVIFAVNPGRFVFLTQRGAKRAAAKAEAEHARNSMVIGPAARSRAGSGVVA
jgi:hypothetical protein